MITTNSSFKNSTITDSMFNLIVGATLTWGFLMNYFIVQSLSFEWVVQNSVWISILYLISAFSGHALFEKSDNPIISFIGYNMIVLPVGVLLVPITEGHDANVLQTVFLQTALITGIMMALGSMFPKFFAKTVGVVSTVVLAIVLSHLASMIFFGETFGVWYEYVIIIGMSIFIGFYWSYSMSCEKTVDKAIDTAGLLYLPIINIMSALLGIRRG